MRFSLSFVTLALALSGVVASPTNAGQPSSVSVGIIVDFNLSSGTKYNAPTPPWEENSHPGWYYGNGKPQVESNQYPCIGAGEPVRNPFGCCSYDWQRKTECFFLFSKVANTWKLARISSSALPRTMNHPVTPRPLAVLLALLKPMITWPMVWSTLLLVNIIILFFLDSITTDHSYIDCLAMCDSVKGCKFVNSKLSTLIIFQMFYFHWFFFLNSLSRCQWQGLLQSFLHFPFFF